MAKDYYAELEVGKGASAEEIKEAYKRLAKKYHPDVNKEHGAEEKFKTINEAYKVLSDPQKRSNYDQFGDAAERFSGFSGFEGFAQSDFDFGDIFKQFGFGEGFSDFFGSGFEGRQRGERGADILVNLQVSFHEAAFGVQKEFFVERNEKCSDCRGQGYTEKDAKSTCSACSGRGFQQKVNRTIIGTIATRSTCSKCHGQGTIITKPCHKCGGRGIEKRREKISVKIPAGIESGSRLRLRGKGNTGTHGSGTGDLFVLVFVGDDSYFKRDHEDIFAQENITFPQAALGSEINVKTIHGDASLKIPKGTQSGTIFRLKGQGIKSETSARTGDQFVKIIVKTPEQISKKQKELFEELAKEEGTHKKKGIFG